MGRKASIALWWLAGLGFSVIPVLLVGGRLTAATWELLVFAALAWGVLVSAAIFFALPLLVDETGKTVDNFGIPNGLSGLRAYVIAPLLIFAFAPLPGSLGFWLFVALGFLAGVLDLLDGIVARWFGPVTKLGKALDPAVDMIFFFVVAVGALALGVMTWWLTALIGARYLIPTLGTPLVLATGRRPEIVHTQAGRVSTMTVGLTLIYVFVGRILLWDENLVCLAATPLVLVTELLFFRSLLKRLAEPSSARRVG